MGDVEDIHHLAGSLGMMVVYPSDFDPAKQSKYQNYPVTDAVD